MTDLVYSAGTPATSGPPSPLEWRAIQEQARVIAGSGLAPRGVDSPEKVMVIALKGRELGVPPMQALSHIHVISGKPTMSAELMVALVQRAGHKIRVKETTAERCVVEGVRADDPDSPATVTFTMEDAETAKVTGKDTWQQYPAAMLRARAISALCRFQFADVLMGCSYTPEELGAEVDDDGNVIDVQGSYLTPEHENAIGRLEEVIAEAEAAGVEGDYGATREYALKSAAHAEHAAKKLRERMGAEPVDAEPVDAGEDEKAQPAGDAGAPSDEEVDRDTGPVTPAEEAGTPNPATSPEASPPSDNRGLIVHHAKKADIVEPLLDVLAVHYDVDVDGLQDDDLEAWLTACAAKLDDTHAERLATTLGTKDGVARTRKAAESAKGARLRARAYQHAKPGDRDQLMEMVRQEGVGYEFHKMLADRFDGAKGPHVLSDEQIDELLEELGTAEGLQRLTEQYSREAVDG